MPGCPQDPDPELSAQIQREKTTAQIIAFMIVVAVIGITVALLISAGHHSHILTKG